MKANQLSIVVALCATAVSWLGTVEGQAQAPGVKIVRDRGEEFEALVTRANELREAGQLLSINEATNQMQRATCELKLPKPATKRLTDREIWQRSRESHVRVGWHYQCKKCSKWHQNLAGGYFITADGVIATCHHVVEPNDDLREGYLVVGTEDGKLFPVTEVLACDATSDTAIIRAKIDGTVKPLPLNTNVSPGDAAWCYSDPLGRSSYFSKGMVNRFFYQPRKARSEAIRMEVSTDWAPGSSGAAVLDECGNAIGHVSEISSASSRRARGTNQTSVASSPMIVFHYASRAADVLALIKPAKEK
jgi:S1-C subfamily serine protease